MANPSAGIGSLATFTSTGASASTAPTGTIAPDTTSAGLDLVYMQGVLQQQMESIQNNIQSIEQNSNLSDTERMFQMQMAMNTWSSVANLRTNALKMVSDTLKSIARNVN